MRVDLRLTLLRQLIHHDFVQICLQEVVLIMRPLLEQELSNNLLKLRVNLIAIVEFSEEREEPLQLLNILNLAIHHFNSLHHEPQLAEHVREEHDADQENEGRQQALEIGNRIKVAKTNSR